MVSDDHMMRVRMSDELRARIAEAAKANSRSMNAEIVHRLEQSFPPSTEAPPPSPGTEKPAPSQEEVERMQRWIAYLRDIEARIAKMDAQTRAAVNDPPPKPAP
jgi:hypothetical protein